MKKNMKLQNHQLWHDVIVITVNVENLPIVICNISMINQIASAAIQMKVYARHFGENELAYTNYELSLE